jgi:hypothetical protein
MRRHATPAIPFSPGMPRRISPLGRTAIILGASIAPRNLSVQPGPASLPSRSLKEKKCDSRKPSVFRTGRPGQDRAAHVSVGRPTAQNPRPPPPRVGPPETEHSKEGLRDTKNSRFQTRASGQVRIPDAESWARRAENKLARQPASPPPSPRRRDSSKKKPGGPDLSVGSRWSTGAGCHHRYPIPPVEAFCPPVRSCRHL